MMMVTPPSRLSAGDCRKIRSKLQLRGARLPSEQNEPTVHGAPADGSGQDCPDGQGWKL